MDSFINLAKQGLAKYEESQGKKDHSNSDYSKTGGAEYNSPSHHNGGVPQPHGYPDLDDDHIVASAAKHDGGQTDLFSTALGFIKSSTGQAQAHQSIDEDHVQRAHDQAYNKGQASQMDASSLGSAAALQAVKSFLGGSSSSSSHGSHGASTPSSGGNSQSQMIALAMAEASKLFDKSGGTASGNKQDAVNGAAATVLKLLVQSKFKDTTGGSSSGGLGGLMSMASKFMK